MTPGPALDRRLWEAVRLATPRCRTRGGVDYHDPGYICTFCLPPRYSSSAGDAWALVDLLRGAHHGWHIDIHASPYGVRVAMIRRVAERASTGTAEAKTFPEALARAAAEALELKEESHVR